MAHRPATKNDGLVLLLFSLKILFVDKGTQSTTITDSSKPSHRRRILALVGDAPPSEVHNWIPSRGVHPTLVAMATSLLERLVSCHGVNDQLPHCLVQFSFRMPQFDIGWNGNNN